MSYIHHDLPKPGRFSLGRVVAARLGHSRRRAMVQMQGRDAWPARANSPEMACWDSTEDDGEPLTIGEAVRFWATVLGPAFVGVIGYAVLIWALQP